MIVVSCTKYFRMPAPGEGLRHRMGLDLGSIYGKKVEKKPREPRNVVILDVGGERFSATRATLLNYPASRLGKLMRAETIEKILEQCDEFVPGNIRACHFSLSFLFAGNIPEYFFDKVSSREKAILRTLLL